MAPSRDTPATSLHRFPRPAAAKVLRPSMTPKDESISSPARIMIKLSQKPKPMAGRPTAVMTVSS